MLHKTLIPIKPIPKNSKTHYNPNPNPTSKPNPHNPPINPIQTQTQTQTQVQVQTMRNLIFENSTLKKTVYKLQKDIAIIRIECQKKIQEYRSVVRMLRSMLLGDVREGDGEGWSYGTEGQLQSEQSEYDSSRLEECCDYYDWESRRAKLYSKYLINDQIYQQPSIVPTNKQTHAQISNQFINSKQQIKLNSNYNYNYNHNQIHNHNQNKSKSRSISNSINPQQSQCSIFQQQQQQQQQPIFRSKEMDIVEIINEDTEPKGRYGANRGFQLELCDYLKFDDQQSDSKHYNEQNQNQGQESMSSITASMPSPTIADPEPFHNAQTIQLHCRPKCQTQRLNPTPPLYPNPEPPIAQQNHHNNNTNTNTNSNNNNNRRQSGRISSQADGKIEGNSPNDQKFLECILGKGLAYRRRVQELLRNCRV